MDAQAQYIAARPHLFRQLRAYTRGKLSRSLVVVLGLPSTELEPLVSSDLKRWLGERGVNDFRLQTVAQHGPPRVMEVRFGPAARPNDGSMIAPAESSEDPARSGVWHVKHLERVLVCVGGEGDVEEGALELSATDRRLIRAACDLADRTACELCISHTIDGPDRPMSGDVLTTHGRAREKMRSALAAEVKRIERECGIDATFRIEKGVPSHQMVELAIRWEADLVIVAPRRDRVTWAERLVYGSTTRAFIRAMPSSIWIHNSEDTAPYTTLAVAADRTPLGKRVMAVGRRLSSIFEVERRGYLHAIDYPDDINLRRGVDPEPDVVDYHERVRAEAAEQFVRWAGEDEPSWTATFTEERITKALPEFVEQVGADLLVLGSQGRSGLSGLLTGNTAERVLSRLGCDIWVVGKERS